MTSASPALPLSGLRVLDFSQFLAGPVAALRLCDLGAEVIKVERPQGGDLCRSMVVNDQRLDGDSLVFHTFNRGKKSVAADLKQPADLDRIRTLIASTDVMIHNFRPGVMERIGLDYETVRALNPRLVYGSVSGYGATGPWRDKPGQDLLVQALSGIAWLNGNAADGPVPTGFAMLDVATAGHLVQGILACLVRRGISGTGGLVEVDLMSAALDMTFEQLTCFLNDGETPPRRHAQGNANPYQPAPYGLYHAADGWMALAMCPLAKLAELLDAPQIADFPQSDAFTRLDEIKSVVGDVLKTRPRQHWLDILEAAGIWCAPVLDWPAFTQTDGFAALDPLQTIRTHSGATARTTRCPIRIDGQTLRNPASAPVLGADTDTFLTP
ncbi:CaiB/BaiF CoA transferase family protein [Antarctobacter heliothermus]|uniref:Crotonobetainyl-CoA:carnitine CoA-transferase CaiB n=1 Tax=Antarctobacter heliothermus TaxID=74033 RepID=A0A239FU99_9RHOB|nr:CoA transferase [Antarctobacter heliothermus]SNS60577.1 Crotonobetainyl-CoA:carnitine CoA-transferase CaiB [Antarctobacter heliothermus]